ncbi:MAG: helix-turn-helix domain-containing protein [bacterium]|nr:helix-turn-helix domain-containing protein [bacterium]
MNGHRNKILYCLVLCLGFALPSYCYENRRPADRYISHRLTTRDGLPQDTVYDIAQDKDGYIWIGTDVGLVRYDGINYIYYTRSNTKELLNNSITALLAARDGTIWIGTFGGGITLYKEKSFYSYSSKNGLPNDFICIIVQDAAGFIWLGTNGGGLIRYKNEQFDVFTTADGLSSNIIHSLADDHKGNLWVGTKSGLNRINASAISTYATGGIADHKVMAVFPDSMGILWVGTVNGLMAFKGNKTVRFTTANGLSNNIIRSLFEDGLGNFWIATDAGLNRIDARHRSRLIREDIEIEPFSFEYGGTPNSLMRMFEDREGNLWIGSTGAGLNILHHRKLRSYGTANGLAHNYIKAVYQDSAGAMWIGTNGGGLNCMKGGTMRTFNTADGLAGNFVNSITADKTDTLWVGTDRGLSRYRDGAFTTFSKTQGLAGESIRVLHCDRAGTLWLGTYGGGLIRFDEKKNSFTAFTTREGLSDNFVLCISEDNGGTLWIGTNKGLNSFKDGTIRKYTETDGLSGQMVYDILPDREPGQGRGAVLWIGTADGGLNYFKDGVFTGFTSRNGLFSNTIYRIIKDNKEDLWMSSNKGIFTVPMRELHQMLRGKRWYLNCTHLEETDGMKSAVCTGGFQPAGIKTVNGHLWFPTLQGVVVLDPQTLVYNTVEPPVLIERILVDGMTRHKGELLELPGASETVKITFTGLSFTSPRKVRFRYRLKGGHDDWRETVSRWAEYSRLPPGDYTFEVKACNNDGVWSSKAASVVFRIQSTFFQGFWFYFLVALVLTGAGAWYYWRPAGAYRQEEAEQEQKYQASSLVTPKARMYSRKLVQLMEQEKPYLDAELTSAGLAETVGISRKHLSQVINQQFNMNFKNFLNKYRVEEAKKKLVDPAEQDFVLLKIALDVGFNSKSVFNEAFKKFTGMTPSQYRKKEAEKK